MICPNCQVENKEGAKFCNECGFPLTGRIANVAAASNSEEVLRAAAMPASAETATSETSKIKDLPLVDTAAQDISAQVDEAEADSGRASSFTASDQPSGPLDPSKLPRIGVKGVDVDEEGNEFDFSAIDEDHADDDGLLAVDAADDQDENEPDFDDSGADLSGFEERLVDSDYAPPASAWNAGGTMEMPRVDGAATPKQKEFRAPDPNEKKGGRGKIVAIVIAVMLVIAGGVAAVTYQMEMWGGKMLPNVIGMTQSDATFQLEGKGFSVRATQIKSDETEGLVLLTDPSASGRAEKGTEVVIHIATPRIIPDIVGKTREEATALLAEEGFDTVVFSEQKSNEAEGTILSVTPEAGSKSLGSSTVEAIVAVPYTVPDVANLSYDEATKVLEEASYVANIVYYYTEEITEGLVVSTDPVAGTKLASESTVTVSVAKSRASVLVAAAQGYLGSAGSLDLGGTTYVIDSVDAVSYTGYNQTSFTITGRAAATLDGETVYGSAKQKSGTITWDDANNIVSIG